jgi:hypothetical protein
MTSWKTSEIARRLAERDDVEPPEGLLEKIKSDIPAELPIVPTLPTLPRVPEIGPRPTPPKRRVWLMAASLAAAVCGGALGLWMMQNAEVKKQVMEETAPQQVPAPTPAPALPPPPAPPAVSREMAQATPAPIAKEKAADLKALGYVSQGVPVAPKPVPPPAAAPPPPPPAKTAPPRDEPISAQAESKAVSAPAPVPVPEPAGAPPGVIGGVAGGSPAEEKDERRADQDKEQMKKRRAPQEAQSNLQKTPAAKTDRSNAGGNEAGKQTRQLSAVQPRLDVSGDAMMRQSRQSLAAGRLPSPETVRVEDFVNAYSSTAGQGLLARSRPAVQADGAPNPFAAGENGRLLRVIVPATHEATVRIDFNPAVVSSWRRLGSDHSLTTAATRSDSVTAGSGLTVLYAVTLKPETQPSQPILTLHLGQMAQDLHLGDLPLSWEKAAPDLRLVSLAAELAEVLRGSPWAQSTDLDDLVRRAHRVAADLAGTPRAAAAADLVKMAEEAARLKR